MTKPLPDGPLSMNQIHNRLGEYHCPRCESPVSARTQWTPTFGNVVRVYCFECGWYEFRGIKGGRNNPPVIPASIEESYEEFLREIRRGD